MEKDTGEAQEALMLVQMLIDDSNYEGLKEVVQEIFAKTESTMIPGLYRAATVETCKRPVFASDYEQVLFAANAIDAERGL